MIKLDQTPRFKLSDLRGFFLKAKLLQEKAKPQPDRNSEYFSKLEALLKANLTLGGIEYTIKAELSSAYEILSFLFEWITPEGESRSQRVRITTKSSNLDLPPVKYFLCPYTAHRCRKLFTDGNVLASRYAFPHTYSKCNRSKNQRDTERALFGIEDKNPYRKNGKTHYRGKITPYGKKLQKFYEEEPKLTQAALEWSEAPVRRGRPPKQAQNKSRVSPNLFLK